MGRKIISGAQGKTGRIFIGGDELCVEEWDIEEIGDEEDTTSTCDAGNADQEFGVTQLQGSFRLTWDISANPHAEPYLIAVGQRHAETQFYINATPGLELQDGPSYLFNMHITTWRNTSGARGKVAFECSFKSYGPYTLPSTSESSGA